VTDVGLSHLPPGLPAGLAGLIRHKQVNLFDSLAAAEAESENRRQANG
jgi:hypothetical protein